MWSECTYGETLYTSDVNIDDGKISDWKSVFALRKQLKLAQIIVANVDIKKSKVSPLGESWGMVNDEEWRIGLSIMHLQLLELLQN